MRNNVLLFAPYGSWMVHHQLDAVLGAALAFRGLRVTAIGCDSFFSNCPINTGDDYNKTCRSCLDSGRQLFDAFRIPQILLNQFIDKHDIAQCKDLSASIPVNNLTSVVFDDCPVGEWVSFSLVGRYHSSSPDLSNIEVEKVARSYANNALLLSRAYRRILSKFSPDYVVCYSGIQFSYRVALELSRQADIPVLVHERSLRMGDSGFLLHENNPINILSEEIANYQRWRDIPLTPDECVLVRDHYDSHERGYSKDGQYVNPFVKSAPDFASTRRMLRIPPDAPLVTVMCSSDWEFEFDRMVYPATFSSQNEGLRFLAALTAKDNFWLVIRHHPGWKNREFQDVEYLSKLLEFNINLPSNVRVIMPMENISSYALMWISDAVITFGSTTGLEAMARGCFSISNISSYLSQISPVAIAKNCRETEEPFELSYSKLLAEARAKTRSFDIADFRQLYRSSFFIYFRNTFNFKKVGIKNFFEADLRVTSTADIAPGADPVLDHVCDHIIYGTPLARLPQPADEKRSEEAETLYLANQLKFVAKRRRLAHKASLLHDTITHPEISVLFIENADDTPSDLTLFYKSLDRSRLKPRHIQKIARNDLPDAVRNASSQYIWIAQAKAVPDESFFSVCVDYLEKAQLGCPAVVSGAYLERNGKIYKEILTGSNSEFDENLGYLLKFLILWRREYLAENLHLLDSAIDFSSAERLNTPMITLKLSSSNYA